MIGTEAMTMVEIRTIIQIMTGTETTMKEDSISDYWSGETIDGIHTKGVKNDVPILRLGTIFE